MISRLRRLPGHCRWLILLILCGCAAPRALQTRQSGESYVVLLPKDGHSSGAVVVTTAQGTQVLDEPWEKTELKGNDAPPGKPVTVQEMERRSELLTVLSALPPQPVHFLLRFRGNTTELLPESARLLPEIVRSIGQRPAAEVLLVGHTDTLAPRKYNYDLGKRRAERVAALLKSMGAAPARVETVSRGECELAVQTPDRTAEPCNRRVEVTVR